MKTGEVLFQGPTHHKNQQKCQMANLVKNRRKFKIDLVPSKDAKSRMQKWPILPSPKKNNLKEVVGLKAQIFHFFQFLLTS